MYSQIISASCWNTYVQFTDYNYGIDMRSCSWLEHGGLGFHDTALCSYVRWFQQGNILPLIMVLSKKLIDVDVGINPVASFPIRWVESHVYLSCTSKYGARSAADVSMEPCDEIIWLEQRAPHKESQRPKGWPPYPLIQMSNPLDATYGIWLITLWIQTLWVADTLSQRSSYTNSTA